MAESEGESKPTIKPQPPLKVRHLTRDPETGDWVARTETFGQEQTEIKHLTRRKGVPIIITRKGHKETEEEA